MRVERDLYGIIIAFLQENGAMDDYLELSQKLLDLLEQKYGTGNPQK